MHLASCLHPHKILNPLTHQLMYVSCGHCEACKNRHQLIWTQRLNAESQSHAYTYFFTLTYDQEHLPSLYYDLDYSTLSYDYSVNGAQPYSIDYPLSRFGSDIRRIKEFSESNGQRIGVVSKRDIQIFMKKFRVYVQRYHQRYYKANDLNLNYYHVKKNCFNEKIRYYIISEYGGKYFRPHYHGLIYCDSPITSQYFHEMLAKSWNKGNVNFSIVVGKAAEYVAKYLNGYSYLPGVYKLPQTRPFSLCSRKPAIGSCALEGKKLLEVVFGQSDTITLWNSKEYVDVPIWKTFENSLFPKCKKFSVLSHSDRVSLYGLAGLFPYQKVRDYYNLIYNEPLGTYQPLRKLLNVGEFKPSELSQFVVGDARKVQYRCLVALCDFDKHSTNGVYESFLSALNLSERVLKNYKSFGFWCLDEYVRKIEDYYSKKDYKNLLKQLEFEDEFNKNALLKPYHLFHLDPLFAQRVKDFLHLFLEYYHNSDIQNRFVFVRNLNREPSKTLLLQLESFGFPLYVLQDRVILLSILKNFDMFNSLDYSNFEFIHNKIARDALKTKIINDDYNCQLHYNDAYVRYE